MMVALNASTLGDHDGPAVAVITLTDDYLRRLQREIEQAKTMKAEDPDLQLLLRWDRRVTWLEHTVLVEELAEATGFDDDSHSWGVVPPGLAERVTAALQAGGDESPSAQYPSEVDRRRTDHEDVSWVAYAKHGDFDFITAPLTASDLADLLARLEGAS